MDLLAVIGDGSLIKIVIWAAVGFLAGWFVPAPAFLTRYLGPKK